MHFWELGNGYTHDRSQDKHPLSRSALWSVSLQAVFSQPACCSLQRRKARLVWLWCALLYFSKVSSKIEYTGCNREIYPFVAKVLPWLRGQNSLCGHAVMRALHPSGLTTLLENALLDFPVSLLSLIKVQQKDVAEREGR